jgi:branched-chain amino acid transport system ATP-binding protein
MGIEPTEMLLEVEGLKKYFGGLAAINGVTLQIRTKELTCIIGPNGAGKTTLFNLVTGRLRPDSGKIIFREENIGGLSPFQIIRKGVGRSFQRANIFKKLSVFENVQLGILCGRGKSLNFFSPMRKMVQDQTAQILAEVGLSDQRKALSGELSHGDQKKLELALAIANQPELLLLDEPTAGMSAEETKGTIRLIGDLYEKKNLTIVVIEHDMDVVFSVAKRIIVMHQGSVLAEGEPQEIRRNEQVQKVYFGEKRWEF